MLVFLRTLLFLAFVLGHIGFWVTLYNRINATGFKRAWIKLTEKVIVLTCLALPFVLLLVDTWTHHPQAWRLDKALYAYLVNSDLSYFSFATWLYICFAIGCFFVQGPVWLAYRPVFHVARDRYSVEQTHIERHLHRVNPHWELGAIAKRNLYLPGNEILSLEANTKILWIDRLPEGFEGMRIGHFSDIHLMGEIPDPYYRKAVEWLAGEKIELLCLTGDLLDEPDSLGSLETIFSGLLEGVPKLFVLGNHDRACGIPDEIRAAMSGLGWLDVGLEDRVLKTSRGDLYALGNERPWFTRQAGTGFRAKGIREPSEKDLILAVSHSPDQWRWGRDEQAHLMLCGHTHGGQVRFPWIGPIIAPSHFGSRFASGVFELDSTLMHVSRGMAGVQPLRWGCLPEITVLELRSKKI